jgi:hypothetical protein
MDPSGDDMDRDIKHRIKSVNAKINIDEFRCVQIKNKNGQIIDSSEHLQDLVSRDFRFERLEQLLAKPQEKKIQRTRRIAELGCAMK